MERSSNETIKVSVVLPCLNEQDAIGACIEKIKDLFCKESIKGEIIVVDNGSTDNSAQIAKQLGAQVISQPMRGYGTAYIAGLNEAQGKYLVIGDADNTYDFYEIPKFIQLLDEGYELVMGSRFRGKMSKGAMSWSHRFIGNPIITFVFRVFFRTNLSDVLSGMRAFTKNAYMKMSLRCLGMEFGTEMIFSSLQKKLRITEVAIAYYPRKGKSKLRPFKDAWRYFRFMLLFSPAWLYLLPGFLLALIGALILVLLAQGPFSFLGRTWHIHPMFLGSLLTLLGFQILNLGIWAKLFAIREGYLRRDKLITFLMRHFRLETGILLGGIFFLVGFLINAFILLEWWVSAFGPLHRIREAILAMTLMVLGLQMVFSSFFLSLLAMEK
ncbi:MAG: glycosyltransferase family 2 protein [Candidatus Omnitrophota bacterium]|nr:MAG: glycosyltransferase family 2 protein [Candidatus Omnitrophota bacterium]